MTTHKTLSESIEDLDADDVPYPLSRHISDADKQTESESETDTQTKKRITHIDQLSVGQTVKLSVRKHPLEVDRIIDDYAYLSNSFSDRYTIRYYDFDETFAFHANWKNTRDGVVESDVEVFVVNEPNSE